MSQGGESIYDSDVEVPAAKKFTTKRRNIVITKAKKFRSAKSVSAKQGVSSPVIGGEEHVFISRAYIKSFYAL